MGIEGGWVVGSRVVGVKGWWGSGVGSRGRMGSRGGGGLGVVGVKGWWGSRGGGGLGVVGVKGVVGVEGELVVGSRGSRVVGVKGIGGWGTRGDRVKEVWAPGVDGDQR